MGRWPIAEEAAEEQQIHRIGRLLNALIGDTNS